VDDLKRGEIGGGFGENGRAFAEQVATLAFRGDGNEVDEKEVVVNSVIQDVQYLRNHPLIKPTVLVTGWYFDLHNGRVEEVKVQL
jgi:carbonic anhydrase